MQINFRKYILTAKVQKNIDIDKCLCKKNVIFSKQTTFLRFFCNVGYKNRTKSLEDVLKKCFGRKYLHMSKKYCTFAG